MFKKKLLNNNKAVHYILKNLDGWKTDKFGSVRKPECKNILHIKRQDNIGGAAILANRLSHDLNGYGVESSMIVKELRSASPGPGTEVIKKCITSHERDLLSYGDENGLPDLFHSTGADLRENRRFSEADLIHFHNLHKGYFSYLALPEITSIKPSVWTLHDMYAITGHCVNPGGCSKWQDGCGNCPDLKREVPVNLDRTALLFKLKQIAFKYSDLFIVAPSKWLKSQLENSILSDKEIHLIYNGVDENIFFNYEKNKTRAELNLPADNIIFLFAANGGIKNRAKGGHLISEIFDRCMLKNVTFVCIGQEAKTDPRIISIPYVENERKLASYLSAADLFLYPTQADNCPLIVLESLACGTPVISFNVGGIPEIVSHKRNGYIAEKNDIHDFMNGIKFFAGNKIRHSEAASFSRLSVLGKFTMRRMTQKYLELYRSRYKSFPRRKKEGNSGYRKNVTSLLSEISRF